MKYSREKPTSRTGKTAESRVIGMKTANARTTSIAQPHAVILKLDASLAYRTEDTTKLANTLEIGSIAGSG